jgi:hypothetical protein
LSIWIGMLICIQNLTTEGQQKVQINTYTEYC